MITQSELKSQLHYEPKTGIFTRLIANCNRIKVGDVAGDLHSTSGYCRITLNSSRYLSHRLAWLYIYGVMPKNEIDHINGVVDDNRIVNLRSATRSQNLFNRCAQKNNTSGYKGVSFDKKCNKWRSVAWLNCKKHHLGLFATPELASQSYQTFAKENHGEFLFRHEL